MTTTAAPRETNELAAEPIEYGTPEWHDFNAIWPFLGYAVPGRCEPGSPYYGPVARGKMTFFPKDVQELVEQSEREITDIFRRDPWIMVGEADPKTLLGLLSFSARVLALQPGKGANWEVAKRFAYVAAWNRTKYNGDPNAPVPDLRDGWCLARDGVDIVARLE